MTRPIIKVIGKSGVRLGGVITYDGGSSDDTSVIQATIDAAAAGSTIRFGGDFELTSPISVTKSLSLLGDNARFLWNVNSRDAFTISGSVAKTVTLTENVAAGSSSITVDDVAGISSNNILLIYDNTVFNPDWRSNWLAGETHEISSVSGSTIRIMSSDPLDMSYSVANGAKCKIISPITAIFDGITLYSTNDETVDTRGIALSYCKDSRIGNSTFTNLGLRAINIDNSIDSTIHNNTISNSNMNGYGYGICINEASAYITSSNNTISNCRHAIAHGGSNGPGQPRESIITGNTLIGNASSHTLDAHPETLSVTITNNTISNSYKEAIVLGAKNATITGNTITSIYPIFYRSVMKNRSWTITNNNFVSTQYGLYISGTSGDTWDYLKFTDNSITGGGKPFYIRDPSPINDFVSTPPPTKWVDQLRVKPRRNRKVIQIRKK